MQIKKLYIFCNASQTSLTEEKRQDVKHSLQLPTPYSPLSPSLSPAQLPLMHPLHVHTQNVSIIPP